MSLNKISQEYKILGKVNHIFSHFHLNLFIVHIKLNRRVNFNGFEWVTEKNLESKPKSTLMKKVKKIMICEF